MIKPPKGKKILVCPCNPADVWPILVGQTDNHSAVAFAGTFSWAGAKHDKGGKPNIRISDDWTVISGYCGSCGKPFNLRISETKDEVSSEIYRVRKYEEGENNKPALHWIGNYIRTWPDSVDFGKSQIRHATEEEAHRYQSEVYILPSPNGRQKLRVDTPNRDKFYRYCRKMMDMDLMSDEIYPDWSPATVDGDFHKVVLKFIQRLVDAHPGTEEEKANFWNELQRHSLFRSKHRAIRSRRK